MEFRQLRALLTVAELGSIRKAALQLHVAQPSLSQTIRSLEDELGVELFVRSTRGVELTEPGRNLCERGERILGMIDEAVQATRGEGLTGTFRLGMLAGAYAAAELTAPLVTSFAKKHPKLQVDLVELDMGQQCEPLINGTLDAALMRLPSDPSGIETFPLIAEFRALIFSPTHPLSGLDSIDHDDLLSIPMLTLARTPSEFGSFWSLDDLRGEAAQTMPVNAVTVDELAMAFRLHPDLAMTAAACVPRLSPHFSGIVLPDAPTSTISLARRNRDRRPVVQHFIAHAQAFCRSSEELMTDAYSIAEEPSAIHY